MSSPDLSKTSPAAAEHTSTPSSQAITEKRTTIDNALNPQSLATPLSSPVTATTPASTPSQLRLSHAMASYGESSKFPTDVAGLCTLCDKVVRMYDEQHITCAWDVINALSANAPTIVAAQCGCPAFIRVFKRVDAARQRALMRELLPKLLSFSMDVFANYVVQCAIEHSDRTTAAQYVVQHFSGHLLHMSCDKYASNVVEKVVCACSGIPAVRELIMDELILDHAALKELVLDEYGNFVVQAVVATTMELSQMCFLCERLVHLLSRSPYYTNIWAKINKRRRELAAAMELMMPQFPVRQEEVEALLRGTYPPPCAVASPKSSSTASQSVFVEDSLASSSRRNEKTSPLTGSRKSGGGRYRHSPYTMDGPVSVPDSKVIVALEPPRLHMG
jgi:hypothetical protein